MKKLLNLVFILVAVFGLSVSVSAQKDDKKPRPPKDPPKVEPKDKPPRDNPRDKDRPQKPEMVFAVWIRGSEEESA